MTTSTRTLAEFLLARIDEDEVRYRTWVLGGAIGQPFEKRLVAECDAKRAIVALHGSPHNCNVLDEDDGSPGLWRGGGPDDEEQCPTLSALAQPYASHPDFRNEWRA